MYLNHVCVASRPCCCSVCCSDPSGSCEMGRARLLAPSRKVRALIAYLVMAPRPVPSRQALRAILARLPNDPRGEVRWCLSKIRGLLGDPSHERVKTENDWVSIDTSTFEVDALWVAERVEAATSGERPRSPQATGGEVRGRVPRGSRGRSHSPVRSLGCRGSAKIFRCFRDADVLSRIITPPAQGRQGASLHSQAAQLAAL